VVSVDAAIVEATSPAKLSAPAVSRIFFKSATEPLPETGRIIMRLESSGGIFKKEVRGVSKFVKK